MTVNKIIIEAHSNPKGLYQIRWHIKGMQNGVNDEMLDMTLAEAYHAAHAARGNLKKTKNIIVKPKNVVVEVNDVKRLAHRDEQSRIWLEDNGYMVQ